MSLSDKERLDVLICGEQVFFGRDVKEFIKKLLKEAKFHPNPTCCNGLTWTELIKKKAGEKLI